MSKLNFWAGIKNYLSPWGRWVPLCSYYASCRDYIVFGSMHKRTGRVRFSVLRLQRAGHIQDWSPLGKGPFVFLEQWAKMERAARHEG